METILNVPDSLSLLDIHNLKEENIDLIKNETNIRQKLYDVLDITKDIVIIGNGPSLDEIITKESIKKKFGNQISDEFYIVCCNETWIHCQDYDYIFAQDELFILHYLHYNKGEKILIAPSLIWRCAGDLSPPDNNKYFNLKNCKIPYCCYKKNTTKNLLCLWQTNMQSNRTDDFVWRMKSVNLHHIHENLKEVFIGQDNGGSMAIKLFAELGFKNFFFIGFGGVGHSSLSSKIPTIKIKGWKNDTVNNDIIEKDILVKIFPNKNNHIRNSDKKYEWIYNNIKNNYKLNYFMY